MIHRAESSFNQRVYSLEDHSGASQATVPVIELLNDGYVQRDGILWENPCYCYSPHTAPTTKCQFPSAAPVSLTCHAVVFFGSLTREQAASACSRTVKLGGCPHRGEPRKALSDPKFSRQANSSMNFTTSDTARLAPGHTPPLTHTVTDYRQTYPTQGLQSDVLSSFCCRLLSSESTSASLLFFSLLCCLPTRNVVCLCLTMLSGMLPPCGAGDSSFVCALLIVVPHCTT